MNLSDENIQSSPLTKFEVPEVGQERFGPITIAADPLTAAFNAAAAFFTFLSTPQGQRVVAAILDFDAQFIKRVNELFSKIHDFITRKA